MAEPIRVGGGNAGDLQNLDEWTAIGPRRAGSEPERRTARALEKHLREMDREAQIEPMRVRPSIALPNLIHAVLGVIGSVVSVYSHALGLAIVAVAAVSALGDLTGAYSGLRGLMPARASQNVISDEDNNKPGVVVLVAHYDSPNSSNLFSPRLAFWPRALLWSLALITFCAIVRLVGISGTLFTIVQFIPTVVLIALTPFLADAALAQPSTGESDNAGGVTTALRLAARYSNRLEHFDLMLLFTGASAHFALGMRPWLKRHRREFETEVTAVIVLDNLGAGAPAFAAKEGPVFTSRMHPTLVEFASDAGATAYTSQELSDAYLTRQAGLPTLRLGSDVGGDHPTGAEALDQAYNLAAAILERIDNEIGPQIA